MGKTIISKKVIRLNDWVYFPIDRWRIDDRTFAGLESWTDDSKVQAIGKIVRVQTNGNFNYDIEYVCQDGGLDVCTRVRSEITPMDRDAARLWRLLYA